MIVEKRWHEEMNGKEEDGRRIGNFLYPIDTSSNIGTALHTIAC